MSVKLVTTDAGVRLWVKVVPGSSRDRVVGPLGDALKIAVSKPPSGGAANQAVIALLASALKVSHRDVLIETGYANPRKQVLLCGMNEQSVRDRLEL
jgi:uncharacterized protein (TIGR00251 family)